MKKIKINNKMAILVLFACIVTAFSFLKGSAVSSQKNEIKTNPDMLEYNITYELNGGRFEKEAPTKYKPTPTSWIGVIIEITNPIKDGYEFLGWTGSNGEKPEKKVYLDTSFDRGDKHYEANWELKKRNVLVDGKTFNDIFRANFTTATEIQFIKGTPNSNGEDVSQARDKSIMAYLDGKILKIACKDEIFANQDSSKMFRDFYYIKDIKFNNFNTEDVENFSEMFDTCTTLVNLDVSMFNTSNATNMYEMFKSCQQLSTINISNFDISKVTNIQGMFAMNEVSSPKLNEIIGLENLDTSQVTSMAWLFNGCENLQNLNIVNWDTSQVTNMHSMFQNCKSLTSLDLSNWDTNNVTDMISMFANAYNLELINLGEKFNIGNSTNITSIFAKCSKLSGEITIKNVINGERLYVFKDCSTDPSAKFIVKYTNNTTKEVAKNLVTTKSSNSNVFLDGESSTLLAGWTFNQRLSAMSGFANVEEIRFIQGTPNKSGLDVSQARDKSIMASIEGTVLTIASEGEIFANSDCTNMFNQYGYTLGTNKKINKITFNNFNTSKVTNMDSMFRFCNLLTSLDLSNFDTSKVTNMNVMFRACNKLTEIKGIEKFDTSKVTTSNYMFYNCGDLSGEITIMNPNVTSYTDMFTGCSTNSSAKFIVKYTDDTTKEIARQMVETKKNSTVIGNVFLYEETSILPEGQKFNDKIKSLSSFTNVTKVIFDYGIPSDISKYPNVDISENGNIMGYINGDTLYVVSNGNIIANTNSARLFAYCYNLKSIDFTNNFNTSQITQMNSMFETCINLVEIKGLEKWNTSQVKDISYMFVGCRNLQNVNVTKFNTSQITNMDYTFKECNKLSGEITISNINTNYYRDIFKDCSTDPNAKFIVKYTNEAIKVVAERMVATKSTNSNVFLYEPPKPATLMVGEQFRRTLEGMSGF